MESQKKKKVLSIAMLKYCKLFFIIGRKKIKKMNLYQQYKFFILGKTGESRRHKTLEPVKW